MCVSSLKTGAHSPLPRPFGFESAMRFVNRGIAHPFPTQSSFSIARRSLTSDLADASVLSEG